jgi:hypothetical protein
LTGTEDIHADGVRATLSDVASVDRGQGLAGVDRLPDFFVVGHAKSGTSALNRMLKRHPQVFMPAGKEPWYFATELHERTPPRPEGTPTTLEQYSALFAAAGPEQVVGEASPQYLWSRTAAARIAEVRPGARIVAVLREPASFLRSLHMQLVETYVETESDLRTALALEDERRRGRAIPPYTYWPKMLLYSDHVRYAEQLRRYSDLFPRDQLLVLIYDDFRRDNETTVRQVLRFIGVDDTLPIEPAEVNPSVRVRSQRLHQLLHSVSVGTSPTSVRIKRALKPMMPTRLRRAVLRGARRRLIYAPPAAPDEQLMSELRMRYREEVVALSEFLDRDLVTQWGYDRLG